MHIFVLGTGMIGTTVVTEMVKFPEIDRITAVDVNQASIDKCLAIADNPKVTGKVAALQTEEDIARVLSSADVAVACLPHSLSLSAVKAAISSQCHLVDLVGSQFMEKMELDEQAKRAGVIIVPGCGVAPGITNFLAAQGIDLLDEADEAVMTCGGIPRHPIPPLWYQVVYRLESMLRLYTKPAIAIQDGEIVELASLSNLQEITFPEPVGLCETVITDAHSTAFILKGKVKNLYEKTVRYPGHWEKMKVIGELGFLDDTPVAVEGISVTPRAFAEKVLATKMKGESHQDVTVMRVEVTGVKDGNRIKHQWEMVDLYDDERNITSMAKTTALPSLLMAKLIATKQITETGVVPIESLIIRDRFQPFLAELKRLGIDIEYKEETFV
ncbi:saccharopine dehydrogenase C-terminal domain-containing protein [Planococcus sp. N064]|uniref:Saccharopine dehydrogenase C-terminal domain-containing protein n=1 Tax=Planococcus liqunii TaxID=3058394 RepID=A0ABT8MV93_9BACL|nr:saccharopine dehydrogenase C-terminal domain-containing protein [Planococcus sp. N064]MCP2036708.1 lysine 6-dehydrogenase [Planomicrobium sp. HSC-17F08]MDN7228789.1 saccharopine dehydrogenase C-terminal domain-containing protein [Planococcus sp. N064]